MQLISEGTKEATYDEIINEMIANAWYSVLEFHVHLSGIWGDGEIKNKIQEFDQQLHSEKMTLSMKKCVGCRIIIRRFLGLCIN